jgi:hypothetical protein
MKRLTLKSDKPMPRVLAKTVSIKRTFFVRHELKKAPARTPAIPPMYTKD